MLVFLLFPVANQTLPAAQICDKKPDTETQYNSTLT